MVGSGEFSLTERSVCVVWSRRSFLCHGDRVGGRNVSSNNLNSASFFASSGFGGN